MPQNSCCVSLSVCNLNSFASNWQHQKYNVRENVRVSSKPLSMLTRKKRHETYSPAKHFKQSTEPTSCLLFCGMIAMLFTFATMSSLNCYSTTSNGRTTKCTQARPQHGVAMTESIYVDNNAFISLHSALKTMLI